jgi:hypothetical protein
LGEPAKKAYKFSLRPAETLRWLDFVLTPGLLWIDEMPNWPVGERMKFNLLLKASSPVMPPWSAKYTGCAPLAWVAGQLPSRQALVFCLTRIFSCPPPVTPRENPFLENNR